MANTEYGYVRNFEQNHVLAPSNWIVVRIDGRGFSKFCKTYDLIKPNDRRALDLMNSAAAQVLQAFPDMVLAYGQSDEYSFVFHESSTLFERRATKLSTSVATMFTAEYCLSWTHFFPEPEKALRRPYPTFDGRCVCYPKRGILRDYLSWRQADCHINNLYNTTFWNMVLKGGMTGTEAERELKTTVAADKNEILFKRFGVNYNNEEEIFRKGSIVYRGLEEMHEKPEGGKRADANSRTQIEKERKRKLKARLVTEHVDIIGDHFWNERPYLLASKRGEDFDE